RRADPKSGRPDISSNVRLRLRLLLAPGPPLSSCAPRKPSACWPLVEPYYTDRPQCRAKTGDRAIGPEGAQPMLGDADDIARLIEPGRISRRVYTDPGIFELEMSRIFGRAWLYVGHESQVPQPGDYITTELGRQPIIMVRHRDQS